MPNDIRRPVVYSIKKKINPHDNSSVSSQVLHLIPSPVSLLGFPLAPRGPRLLLGMLCRVPAHTVVTVPEVMVTNKLSEQNPHFPLPVVD